jgi:hypothetical protein
MKVNRKKVSVGKVSKNDEGYAGGSPAKRVSFMWDLTAELWSLKKSPYVERRLQRNITKLIRYHSSQKKYH